MMASGGDRKIVNIIIEQSKNIEERCVGYRDEIVLALADILEYERLNRISPTNIQVQISEKCNATARFLSHNRQNSEKG